MFWTLLALLLMIVLGGFISYYGDLQGRRWGKKRVTWFGLRPKYTAILITSLTGAIIAMMSIVTLLLVSPTVRDIVLSGEQAIRENKRLNRSLVEERQQQNEQIKILDSQLTDFRTRIATIRADLQQREKDLKSAREELVPTQKKLALLETEKQNLDASLKQVRAEIAQKSAELQLKLAENRREEARNRRLAIENNKLAKTLKDKEKANGDLQLDTERMNGVMKRQTELQDGLTRIQDDLLRKNQALQQEKSQIEENNRARTEELTQRQQELERAQQDLDRVRKDVDQARRTFRQISQTITLNYHTLRQGQITIRAGAEIGRRVIPAHPNLNMARKQVIDALEEASLTAQALYKADRGDNKRAVRIVTRRASTLIDMDEAAEPENIELVADHLTHSETPVLLVITSLNNCVAGEQVLVDVQLYASIPVFKKGEAVASRLINSRLPLAKVKASVMDFLQNDVRDAAVQAGIVSVVNPVSGMKEIGLYDAVELNVLADHIKRLGGNVLLKAVANNVITTADSFDTNHLRMVTTHVDD